MIVLASLLFASAMATVIYGVMAKHTRTSEIDRVRRRLGIETEAERLADAGGPILIRAAVKQDWLQVLGSHLRINDKLQKLIETSGSDCSAQHIQKRCALIAIITSAVILVAGNEWTAIAAIPAGIVSGMLPVLRLRRATRNRLQKFEAQFPGALEFIARSMRAGHAFSISLEMLYHECDQPIAGEFRRVFEEQNLGMPLDAALSRLATRVNLIDVQFFVSAVVLQRRTGGNLTEILDGLAEVIRERYKLKGKVRAVSAHGRMTARALSLIPIVVGAMMFVVNKEYTNFFFHTVTGVEMLAASLFLQLVAYLVINKIVTIEV